MSEYRQMGSSRSYPSEKNTGRKNAPRINAQERVTAGLDPSEESRSGNYLKNALRPRDSMAASPMRVFAWLLG